MKRISSGLKGCPTLWDEEKCLYTVCGQRSTDIIQLAESIVHIFGGFAHAVCMVCIYHIGSCP